MGQHFSVWIKISTDIFFSWIIQKAQYKCEMWLEIWMFTKNDWRLARNKLWKCNLHMKNLVLSPILTVIQRVIISTLICVYICWREVTYLFFWFLRFHSAGASVQLASGGMQASHSSGLFQTFSTTAQTAHTNYLIVPHPEKKRIIYNNNLLHFI